MLMIKKSLSEMLFLGLCFAHSMHRYYHSFKVIEKVRTTIMLLRSALIFSIPPNNTDNNPVMHTLTRNVL